MILNLFKDPDDERDYIFTTNAKLNELMVKASTVNYVDHSNMMSPVKDQGKLGSCVAFAVAAMKEWQENVEFKIEKKKDIPVPKDFSEMWIYWNCKRIDPWPNVEGTSIRYGMKVLHHLGVPSEIAWPYQDSKSPASKPKSWSSLIAKWAIIDSYYRISTLTELKAALINGPVVIGVGCFEEIFFVGKNGIVPYPKNPAYCIGGHAVCCVGYDDSRRLVKFKNSWGTGWGETGYGYFTYDYINSFLWDAWVAIDASVSKVSPLRSKAVQTSLQEYSVYFEKLLSMSKQDLLAFANSVGVRVNPDASEAEIVSYLSFFGHSFSQG